ncbi:MAG: HEAT repeat domain-containing protein [Candidatus Pacebacteria bacterium]|nr:HEAT repeat domain-containing protein [Candidatus Paceibacterota bacterium]
MGFLGNFFGPDIKKLLEDEQYEKIRKLALKDERVVPRLIAQLESKNSQMVARAANLLGEINDPRALPALDRVVGEKSIDDTHVSATLGRMSLSLPGSFPQYSARKYIDKAAFAAAKKALSKIIHGDEKPLVLALKDKNTAVRAKAAEALGTSHPSEYAIQPLIAVSNQDGDLRVRRKARLALMKIGKPAVQFLVIALGDKNPLYRRQTAWTLYWLWDRHKVERAAEAFLEALDKKDISVVAGAYGFFILRGEVGTEPILIKALENHGHPEMAEHFINCGNTQLEEAGENWSASHGFQVRSSHFGGGPKWGAGREE